MENEPQHYTRIDTQQNTKTTLILKFILVFAVICSICVTIYLNWEVEPIYLVNTTTIEPTTLPAPVPRLFRGMCNHKIPLNATCEYGWDKSMYFCDTHMSLSKTGVFICFEDEWTRIQ